MKKLFLVFTLACLSPAAGVKHLQYAAPVVTEAFRQQLNCLAANIYHEARGEPQRGKLAVAYVTLNRTKHPKFPSSICAVVHEPGQFSWTKDKRKVKQKIPQEFQQLAYKALTQPYKFSALYFHSTKVKPKWGLRGYTTIGNHIFYV